jgi:hypothetical protein
LKSPEAVGARFELRFPWKEVTSAHNRNHVLQEGQLNLMKNGIISIHHEISITYSSAYFLEDAEEKSHKGQPTAAKPHGPSWPPHDHPHGSPVLHVSGLSPSLAWSSTHVLVLYMLKLTLAFNNR